MYREKVTAAPHPNKPIPNAPSGFWQTLRDDAAFAAMVAKTKDVAGAKAERHLWVRERYGVLCGDTTIRKASRAIAEGGAAPREANTPASVPKNELERTGTEVSFVDHGDTATFTGKSYRIQTFEELAAYTGIDFNVWEEYDRTSNKWEVAAKDANGRMSDENCRQLLQVKAKYRKRKGVEVTGKIIREMLEEAEKFMPAYPKIQYQAQSDPHLKIFGLPDPHVGKLCWAAESGDDYDLKIACRVFMDAIRDLAAKSSGIQTDRIILPLGNDFFNSDGIGNATTNGTPQDTDGRWQKLFQVGKELCVEAIDYLSAIAPVEVVCVPGNHDGQTSVYLAQVLDAWYRNCPNTTVDVSPGTRKYVHYGKNLIGMTHGNMEKKTSLPTLMMTEQRRIWGQCNYGEFLTGHLHTRRETEVRTGDEDCSIRTVVMSSLSPSDAWHSQKGFRNMRAAEVFCYHPERGRVATFATYPQ